MTLEEQIKIAEKVSKFMWQEFNKKEMDMGEALSDPVQTEKPKGQPVQLTLF